VSSICNRRCRHMSLESSCARCTLGGVPRSLHRLSLTSRMRSRSADLSVATLCALAVDIHCGGGVLACGASGFRRYGRAGSLFLVSRDCTLIFVLCDRSASSMWPRAEEIRSFVAVTDLDYGVGRPRRLVRHQHLVSGGRMTQRCSVEAVRASVYGVGWSDQVAGGS
jgi:hypothetical protein